VGVVGVVGVVGGVGGEALRRRLRQWMMTSLAVEALRRLLLRRSPRRPPATGKISRYVAGWLGFHAWTILSGNPPHLRGTVILHDIHGANTCNPFVHAAFSPRARKIPQGYFFALQQRTPHPPLPPLLLLSGTCVPPHHTTIPMVKPLLALLWPLRVLNAGRLRGNSRLFPVTCAGLFVYRMCTFSSNRHIIPLRAERYVCPPPSPPRSRW
jgi:hypothetical protein